MQLRLGGALNALALSFTKLAFWRKPAAEGSADAAPPAPTAPEPPAPENTDTNTADAETETPVPRPGLLQRLKALFRRSHVAIPESEAEAAPESAPEAIADAAPGDDESTPLPRPGLLARFKILFRRKAAPAEGEDAAEQASEAVPAEGEGEAPAPRGLLHRLRSKWVWIPALTLLLLGVIGTVAAVLLRSAHETQRLQQELQAAKRKLQQQAAPAAVAVAPPAAPKPAPPPEPKRDPAFDIVGVKPAPEAESGINAGDCVVSDREEVASNLKRCIDSFNAALSASNKKGKP